MDSHSKAETSHLDAVFPSVEDFISREKGEDYKCGSKRKMSVLDHPNLSSVFTPQWREALCRFAQNIPMGLLIQEFHRYYSIPISICHDSAAVYASRPFQHSLNTSEQFIVINNNNLDIWAFSTASKRWFLLKIPCDWEELGTKTLGVKATADGLFLVARSDFNLFVVNPLTAQVKMLPRIFPDSENRVEFLQSLIVQGTAEMEFDNFTGNYRVYLFGNWGGCVQVARYTSTTKLWTIQQMYLNGVPLNTTIFPSPLWSYRHGTRIVCISSTCQHFSCTHSGNHDVMIIGSFYLNIPATIEFQRHGGALPIMVSYSVSPLDNGFILVGRVKENDSVKGMHGKLPVVSHFSLGIWKFNGDDVWEMIDTVKVELLEEMIKSSEGTDFLVVGTSDGETIWLMLRGSESMVQYDIGRRELLSLPGCPGGGYMDTNLHWKAKIGSLTFNEIEG